MANADLEDMHSTVVSLHDRTQEWLLQEIDIISNHLHAIRSRLNAQNMACRIPEELLLAIFFYTTHYQAFSNLNWISVTHVCRFWRHTALSSQRLWSVIVPQNRSYVSAWAERAGTAPLHLRWDSVSGDPDFDSIRPYKRRFVTVELQLDESGVERLVNSECFYSFSIPWENLERLVVSRRDRSPSLSFLSFTGFAYRPPPNLHVFRLMSIIPSSWLFLPVCSSLRSLHLIYGRLRDTTRSTVFPTMGILLDLLHSLPLLEDVSLSDAYRNPPGSNPLSCPDPQRKVELNHLRELLLTFERGIQMAHLLAHLIIPAKAHLHLVRLGGVNDIEDLGVVRCLPLDRSGIKMMNSNTLTQVRVGSHHSEFEFYLQICAFHDDHTANLYPCLHLKLDMPDEHVSVYEAVRSLLLQFGSAFVPAFIKRLDFELQLEELCYVRTIDWHRILLPFVCLSTLVLRVEEAASDSMNGHSEYIRTFLSALTDLKRHSNDPKVVPRLEQLQIVGVHQSTMDVVDDAVVKCFLMRKARPGFSMTIGSTPMYT